MKLVDTHLLGSYKSALLATVTLLLTATTAFASGLTVGGAILPPGSRQVGQNRFKSPSSYAETLNFYSKQYKSNPRKTVASQPGMRAVHIVNEGKGDWEGLNIYELEGETRIFVLLRQKPEKK
jgi:hypothetical protein